MLLDGNPSVILFVFIEEHSAIQAVFILSPVDCVARCALAAAD